MLPRFDVRIYRSYGELRPCLNVQMVGTFGINSESKQSVWPD
jgi:hypothetical protein